MSRLTWRDYVAAVLAALAALGYVGFLSRGEMPLVEDARGMAGIGLFLGAAAFAFLTAGSEYDRVGWIETSAAVVSLLLGIAALAFAETAAGGLLLAVFIVSIVGVVAAQIADHAGFVHWHGTGAKPA